MKTFNIIYDNEEDLKNFIKNNEIFKFENILVQIFTGLVNENLLIEISNNIKETLPKSHIIGTTTAGEICEGKMTERGIVISFSVFEHTKISSKLYSFTDQNINIQNAIDELVDDDTKILIVFSDGLQTNGEEIIDQISKYKPDLVIAGGRAGDNQQFQDTFVFNEKELSRSGCIIAALSSKELYVHNDYLLNWQSLGQDMVVTKSDQNHLFEINHMKAFDVYKKYLGEDIIKELPFAGIEFPLIFEKNGVTVARAPIAVLEDGSFLFGGNLKEGTHVKFGFGDVETIKSFSNEHFNQLKQYPIESIFIYSCSARKALMGKDLEVEFGQLQQLSPTSGFFTYGEYYHNKNINELLNITSTFLCLSESSSEKRGKDIILKNEQTKEKRTLNALTHLLKVTSQELNNSYKVMNHAQNIGGIGSFEWDIKENKTWWSDELYNILGVKREGCKSDFETFISFVHPLDKDEVEEKFKRFLESKDSFFTTDHMIIPKSAEIKTVRLKCEVVRELDDTPLRIMAVVKDITKEKDFETIFNSSKDGMAILDLESNFLNCNEAYSTLTGYTKEELFHTSCVQMSVPEDHEKSQKALQEVIDVGYIKNFEKSCIMKNGERKTISMTISMMPDNQRILISARDITQSNKLKEELIRSKNKAQEASKAKSEFLANMSHEIRTPLNAIIGFVDLLSEKETDKEKQKYLNIVNSASQSLLEIINDILDFSKIESGKLAIEYIDFNPLQEFKVTKKLFKAKATEKKVRVHVSYNEFPEVLNGDVLRIKQVINNLISNAIKFTPSGKNIYLEISYDKGFLNVSVKDEGIGISKEYQSKIFEAFSQEDSSTTRKYGGTGLGLTISYSLVKSMGGELKLRSEPGVGSEFYFSLPMKEGKEIVQKEYTDKNIDFEGKILLVEDNKANQLFMKVLLKKMNLKFDIANDGQEAVDMFKKSKYGAVLMDENMPNMNGIEATSHILKYEQENSFTHTPIVALTANALKGDRERFIAAGMDEYLTKPLDKNKLTEVLSNLLRSKKGE